MNQVEKSEILQKVSSILQFCQEILSKLSSSSAPEEEVNNNDNLDKEANKELIETITKFRDEEQEHHDIDCEDDLWWDTHYPPSHFYTLVFDDDNVSLYSLDTSYADFLLPSDMLEDVRLPSDTLGDGNRMTNKSRDVSRMSENLLMQSVVKFLFVATPNAIYDPKWRQKYIQKWVVPELLPVWTNADDIFDDKPGDDVQCAPPVIQYPSIDLHNVNTRFIDNIPKPSLFPVHGVSSDPDFYHKWIPSHEPYKSIQKFLERNPFGSEYGYDTNIGVVLPSTEPVHGYIWVKGEGWKLHAVKPGEGIRSSFRRRG